MKTLYSLYHFFHVNCAITYSASRLQVDILNEGQSLLEGAIGNSVIACVHLLATFESFACKKV